MMRIKIKNPKYVQHDVWHSAYINKLFYIRNLTKEEQACRAEIRARYTTDLFELVIMPQNIKVLKENEIRFKTIMNKTIEQHLKKGNLYVYSGDFDIVRDFVIIEILSKYISKNKREVNSE